MLSITEIEDKVYAESGCEKGNCPLCNSTAYSDGYCDDCGIDLISDWSLGEAPLHDNFDDLS